MAVELDHLHIGLILVLVLFPQGLAVNNGEKTEEGSKHHSGGGGGGKHKRKKHKHRSKHKKHKHASDEDKERKRKHRHKHRKHKRKEGSSPSAAIIFGSSGHRKGDSSPSSGNPSLDDRALLEDLEKQRALIKAELDSQLMEGKVQSGMGLILQGYNSGSEEDGEACIRNGEQHQRSSGKPATPRKGKSGKSRRDSIEGGKASARHRSRSRSRSGNRLEQTKETKEKMTKTTKDTAVKERGRARSRSKDRKRADSTDRSKERTRKSNSPSNMRGEQKSSRSDKRSSSQQDDRPNQERASRQSRSPRRERPSRSEAERDKRPGKSPSKDASSGKENRSPQRRAPHSPARKRSASPRHRDAHRHSASTSERTSKRSHSPSRTRTPPRRGRSRSPDLSFRRRDMDRQDSPVRLEKRAHQSDVRRNVSRVCFNRLLLQEAPSTRLRPGSIPRQQSQIGPSPQDKSLASETKVAVTVATLPVFTPQTLPNETQVITLTC